MKCTFCGSERIEEGVLFGSAGPQYYENENGKAVLRTARMCCDLCLACGTVLRAYVKGETELSWAHEAVSLKTVKKVYEKTGEEKEKTLAYYNQKHESFSDDTKDLEFSEIQDRFLSYLSPGSLILDLGCGTGRDSRYFLRKGFRVEAADGSEEMVKTASETAGIPVRKMLFEELDEKEKYDGIFACASLLHVCFEDLPDIMARIRNALKKEGTAYVSFKYGTFEGYRNGRYFTDLNEEKFAELLSRCGGLTAAEEWISSDARPGREKEKWLNAILKKTE